MARVKGELEKLNIKLKEISKETPVRINIESFSEAIDQLDLYKDNLYELINNHNSFLEILLSINRVKDRIDQDEKNIDDLKISINSSTRKYETYNIELEGLLKRAEKEGIEDIIQKIKELKNKRFSDQENMKRNLKLYSKLEKELEIINIREIELRDKTISLEDIEESYRIGLEMELDLEYVVPNDFDLEKRRLKELKKELYTTIDESKGVEYSVDLNNKFNIYKNSVSDYKLNHEILFIDHIDGILPEILTKLKRSDIYGKISGKKTGLMKIIEDNYK